MSLRDFFSTLFQTDKDWESRVLIFSLIFGTAWAIIGGADALIVRLQESSYGLTGNLISTPWVYYAGLTLHAMRMLFGFAQQIEMGVFVFLVVRLLSIKPSGKWLIWLSLILINLSIFFFEGPIPLNLSFIDSYFSGTGWDSLAPLGVQGYSQYVVSPLWWLGWLCLELSTFIWGGWILYNAIRGYKGKLNYVMYFVILTTILFVMGYIAPFISTNWEWLSDYANIPLNTLYNQTIFWFYGHAIVYILFLPAVAALYFLIPVLVNREIYSERLAKVSAVLYLAFSNIVPIHHLYLTVYPYWVNLLQEIMTYGVVVPSIMTFFNLWATVKGVKNFSWTVPAAFSALSFGGAIAAGVTGVANATVSFDAIIHNTMWVVGHFHAMIVLMIVPGAFALLYVLIPLVTGRQWFSPRLSWLHFWFTLVGGAGIAVFMDDLGIIGILRRSMIFPRFFETSFDQVSLTVFALIFGIGQIFFILNTLGTLFSGSVIDIRGLDLKRIVWLAAASTSRGNFVEPEAPKHTVSIKSKGRMELTWTALAVTLLALTVIATFPYESVAGGSISNIPAAYLDSVGSSQVRIVAHQYYWTFDSNTGDQTMNYFVVSPGERILFNGTTAAGNGLANFYMPIFNNKVLDNELYQDYNSYLWFTAPQLPGVYGFMNGEYDGPFYTYMGGEMLVMPDNGVLNSSQLNDYINVLPQDPYTPPLVAVSQSANLVMSDFGMWNGTDPAPTIVARNGSTISLTFRIDTSSLKSYWNYLFNVTNNNLGESVESYLISHNNQLPFKIGLIHIYPNGSTQIVTEITPIANSNNAISFTVQPGIYVYGVLGTVGYSFNPYGMSGPFLGEDSGSINSLWGAVIVTQ
ncbi:MAG: cbb3-type cytochrome c oxidase subunit I [Conexivisphaerales archaeon]